MTQAAAQQTSGKIPFRYGSRRRIQRVGFVPFQEGAVAAPLQLPNVGYLAGIMLTWRGQITGTGVSPKVSGPWNLLRRVRLNLNLGSASVIDVSGYGLHLLNSLNGHAFQSHPLYSNTSRWHYFIPVAANLGENFSTGLILLQDPQLRANLEITYNTLSAVFNGTGLGAASGAGVEVHYVYWEVPNLEKVSQPPLVLHRVVEDTMPVSQAGEVPYLVPRQGILLQMLHILVLNGAYSDAWEKAFIRLNRVDTVSEATPDVLNALQILAQDGYDSGNNLPSHVIPWDLFSAGTKAGSGDLRDALDTEAITTTESVVVIPSSATFGTGNNFIHTVRRILQPIQP